jgi:hypothetical protein
LDETKQAIAQRRSTRLVEQQKRATDRMQASSEYMVEAKARVAKTARLRQLRLAKEEADRASGAAQPPKARVERAPRSVKGKTLSARILIKHQKA